MNPALRERAFQIARALLAEQVGVVEAARTLCPLIHAEPGLASETDRNLIIGIDSETDDLPVGNLRELWHPDFLPEKDQEIERCNALWRDALRSACERILLREQRAN